MICKHSFNIKQFYLTIDRTLSGAINPGQSGPGSNRNLGDLHILQSSKIGASASYCLLS